ncbi:hypothetical protein ACFX13_021921 [Malus domestica]
MGRICFGSQGGPPAGQYPTDEELGGVVGVNEDLDADADSFDLGVGVVSNDVSLDPVGSKRLRLGGGEERSTVTLMLDPARALSMARSESKTLTRSKPGDFRSWCGW